MLNWSLNALARFSSFLTRQRFHRGINIFDTPRVLHREISKKLIATVITGTHTHDDRQTDRRTHACRVESRPIKAGFIETALC